MPSPGMSAMRSALLEAIAKDQLLKGISTVGQLRAAIVGFSAPVTDLVDIG